MDAQRLICEVWAQRDDRYADRWIDGNPAALTPQEADVIRTFRLSEASLLPFGKGRAAAFAAVMNWKPPTVVEWRDPILRLDAYNARHRKRWANAKPAREAAAKAEEAAEPALEPLEEAV